VGLVGGDVPPPLAYAGGVGLVMPVAGVRRGVIPASGMKLTIEVAATRSSAVAALNERFVAHALVRFGASGRFL
jgi:hypothetical protein